jgi:hypothetical protein
MPEPGAAFLVKPTTNPKMMANWRELKAWTYAIGFCLLAAAGAGCSRMMVEAPPPARADIITTTPGPGYVWVGGYWGLSWGHYVWIRGHWERPERLHAHWVQPRWEYHDGGYVFVKGYWR